VVLFEAWAADHVHFSYWSFGATPMRHYNGGSGSTEGPLGSIADGVNLASHPSTHYHAYRYRKIVDDSAAGNGVVSGDVTGDGRSDMIARKPDGTLWLYTNGGSNTAPYSTGILIGSSWQNFRWFLAGDVTGDGRADLVAAGQDGTLTLYTNGGSNTAPYSTGILIGSSWQNFRNVTLADVTGDGRADLVAVGQDGTLTLFTNGGSNTAPYATGTLIGTAWQQFTRVMAGDVTGDGRADLVATKPDGTLTLYTNGGSNTAPYSTGILIGSGWQNFRNVTLADVTGDGRADLVAVGQDGTLTLYTNGGSNTAPYATGILIGTGWQNFD
jgi:FG-GAP-like repeat